MPEISRITLEYGSVASSLSQIKQDILPDEIAHDPLAQWVMSFDELHNRDQQRNLEWHWERGNWQSNLYGHLIASILQNLIPFYFASLFHIGRQWQVAEFSLETIRNIQQHQNLMISIQNLSQILRAHDLNKQIGPPDHLLTEMCDIARDYQTRQLSVARKWWKVWRKEVASYRRIVEKIQEYLDHMPYERSFDRNKNGFGRQNREVLDLVLQLAVQSLGASSLKEDMQQYGVKFKPEILGQGNTTFKLGQHYWWMLVGLTLAVGDDKDFYLFRDLFFEWSHILREQQLLPEVEIALGILKHKYGDHNPFMPYSVGKLPPSLELLALIREHKLPNGRNSPWLESWDVSLNRGPDGYSNLPAPGSHWRKEFIISWVRSADSTIKRNLAEGPKFAESWNDFLQRIFEKRWIQEVGRMASKTNQGSLSARPWNVREFQRLVREVTARLNEVGYSLTTPSITRLSTLLEKARRGEYMYEDGTW